MFGSKEEIVIYDAEYTTWEGAHARNWSGTGEYKELVELGAILVETENFVERGSFQVLVKPVKNPQLSHYFTRLTGIEQETVDREGVTLAEALDRFARWVGDRDLYSYGPDDADIKRNCELIGVRFPFGPGRCFDIRSFFRENGIPAEKYMSSTIIEAFGKKSGRHGHDAVSDARAICDALRELRSLTGLAHNS